MSTIICILVFVIGFVGYKYIYPWATKTIEKNKIEGLNQYMGRQVLHIEKTESAYCYCWDFDFAKIRFLSHLHKYFFSRFRLQKYNHPAQLICATPTFLFVKFWTCHVCLPWAVARFGAQEYSVCHQLRNNEIEQIVRTLVQELC